MASKALQISSANYTLDLPMVMMPTGTLTGQKFGHLTAICPTKERKNGYTVWQCSCDCGRPECPKIVMVSSRILKAGKKTDCGCEKKRSYRYQDLTGQRFGKLIVRSEAGNDAEGRVLWHCDCDCGGKVITTTGQLKWFCPSPSSVLYDISG